MESISERRRQRCFSRGLSMWCCTCFKIIILVASESAWSLAESISKGNATSVRSPNPAPTHQPFTREPIGFRKIQFSNDSYQVVQLQISNADAINDFTACAWLKLESTTTNLTLLSYHPRGSLHADGALRWWISNGGTSIKLWLKNKLVMKKGIKLGDGKWRHICQDWRGSTGRWALHISGLKSLSGSIDEKEKNWTLPGMGYVRISSENGGEVYGLTLERQGSGGGSKRGARHIGNETEPVGNWTSSDTEEPPSGSSPEDEDKPEVLNATAEALFWNRGSSRQVDTRASSIGRVAAFLTRVIAFAIIPAMAIVNEMRKNRAKSNQVKNIDSQDDDFNFKLADTDPTTTKAPEKVTATTPFNFDTFEADFEKNNFGSVNVNSVNNAAKGNGGTGDSIDPFFANDDDYFRTAENKHVAKTSKSNQTRASRSYSSQCQSSLLVNRSNGTAMNQDLVLLGSYCCWSEPPPESIIFSWFHTPLHSYQGVKLVDVSKSNCGYF